jgi:5-methylcytosine-specific restriction enzyme A
MPRRPKRPCNQQGCPALVEPGERYCPLHKKEHNKQVRERRTDKEYERLYKTAAWKKFRAAKLKRDPLCERCYAKGIIREATTVHHIEEIRQGGAWIPDFDEAESMCKSCHSRHHGGWR